MRIEKLRDVATAIYSRKNRHSGESFHRRDAEDAEKRGGNH